MFRNDELNLIKDNYDPESISETENDELLDDTLIEDEDDAIIEDDYSEGDEF